MSSVTVQTKPADFVRTPTANSKFRGSVFGYLLLFLPFLMAEFLQWHPLPSYLIAWGGSFFIFYLTLTGKVKALPEDRSLIGQIMRPIVLTQLIFAGYMAVTSIFFFLNVIGYYYLEQMRFAGISEIDLHLTAAAQRLYVLGHGALSMGILLTMDYRNSGKWQLRKDIDLPRFLLVLAVLASVASIGLRILPGLGQLGHRATEFALVASVLSFAVSLPGRRPLMILANGGLYSFNIIQAALSGWKEEVIVICLLFMVFLYPFYRRLVTIGAPVLMVVLFVILPTYNNLFRQMSWSGQESAAVAARMAVQQIEQGEVDVMRSNWSFLTGRLSEIGMFHRYLQYTNRESGFYGWAIVEQSAASLVPRAFWPDKPITERLVMERVYENNVVDRASGVSAKPQYVVDGYLSAGAWGVFFACLFYGLLASLASRTAEKYFGGYLLGSGLIYTALFQIMWRGNSFEFFFNAVCWSFVLMGLLFLLARAMKILVPVSR